MLVVMQVSPEELQSDAEEVFAIAECDPEFEGIMRELEHHQAKDAVYEAVEKLHTSPEPDPEAERIEFISITPEVYPCQQCPLGNL